MITILPADEAFLKEINAPAGIKALVLRGSDGAIEGHALFRVDGDAVEILSVTCDEPIMVSGMIRSVLNAGEYHGANFGLCRVAALEKVLLSMEFKPVEEGWRINIAEFFRGKCAGE